MGTLPQGIDGPYRTAGVNFKYALKPTDVNTLFDKVVDPDFWDSFKDFFTDRSSYIQSIQVFPVNLEDWDLIQDMGATFPYMRIGKKNINEITDFLVATVDTPLKQVATFTINRYFNNFLDFAPYTKLYIYLPFIGEFELNINECINKTLTVKYGIDLETGICTAFVSNNDKMLLTESGQMSIHLPIGRTNNIEIYKTIFDTSMRFIGSLGTSAYAYSAMQYTPSLMNNDELQADIVYGSMVKGATNGILTVGSIAGHAVMHKTGRTNLQEMLPTTPYITIARPKIVNTTNYNKLFGKPLMESRLLSSLSGYTEIAEIHLENFDTALTDEIKEIEKLLKKGIIL